MNMKMVSICGVVFITLTLFLEISLIYAVALRLFWYSLRRKRNDKVTS